MKKKTIITLIIISVSIVLAGMYGYSSNSIYEDPVNNRIYIGINELSGGFFKEDSKIEYDFTNYMVYEPQTKIEKLIFPEDFPYKITDILFEVEYDSVNQKMVFGLENKISYGEPSPPSYLVNNSHIKRRDVKNKLLFRLTDERNKQTELWVCEKDGTSLERIDILKRNESFHLDVRNQVVRIISQADENSKIKEIDW